MFIPLLVFRAIYGIYIELLAIKIEEMKMNITNNLQTLSYADVKQLEDSLVKPISKFKEAENKLSQSSSNLFYKKILSEIKGINASFVEIRNTLAGTYSYTAEEESLSKEQEAEIRAYWENFKVTNPETFAILQADTSSEELIFDEKKANATLSHAQH